MVLLLRKLYLYFTKDPEGSINFQGGGGVSNFSQGGGGVVQMLISLETHIRTCYFPGVSGPPVPLWIRTGNVIITGQYLSQSRF